jgi:glycolate oxidase FAD binding subunit
LKPRDAAELSRMLAEANADGKKVAGFDLAAFNRVLEHTAEDMTCRVEAGVTLDALQTQLGHRGQWLPLDPPAPEQLTIGDLLLNNPSGPRRFGYGTVRDYLIGVTMVLADGRIIHSGGNVVKNVAGYDLMKLFIGSRGSLGVVVEATFKLRPIAETESFVQAECATLEAADKMIGSILESELTPVVLDLHNLARPGSTRREGAFVVLGLAGTREEVDWQLSRARDLGVAESAALDYDSAVRAGQDSMQTISVLPSKLIAAIQALKGAPFVARAGNGVIYHAGARTLPVADSLSDGARKLGQRLKDEFDPKHILPGLCPSQ